jgi:hypoxanthine phosphoribosyltransferase
MRPPVVEVTWQEVERLVALLADRLRRADPSIERIVAVARGGLVPGGLLAARLGVRRVETVQVRHYDGMGKEAGPVLLDPATERRDASRTVVVDDVLETGATLAVVRGLFPGARVVVLFAKGACDGVLAAAEAASDRWLAFPWSGDDER